MKRTRKWWSALGTASASLAGLILVGGTATQAHADTRCLADWIYINASPGGDPKQRVLGHSHNTGKHYIRSISNSVYEWWADNDGGQDGDSPDTFYGRIYCY